MAVSAFKSNSKRGTMTSSSSSSSSSRSKEIGLKEKSVPPRRSRSISAAFSHEEFINKRDNPLFCTQKTDNKVSEFRPSNVEIRRGRSVSRNSDVGVKDSAGIRPGISRSSSRQGRSVWRNADVGVKDSAGIRPGIGRSLPRRGRSVSVRPAVSRQHSESEAEQEYDSSSNYRQSEQTSSSGRNVDMISDSSSSASCFHIPDWEHGSAICWSEAEENTNNAVIEQIPGGHVGGDFAPSGIYEIVRSEVRCAISDFQSDLQTAIGRNNTTSTVNSGDVDALADVVNPDAVDLVLDIRREYAIELEQSHERARKLRADLAVEEHRGLELSRILKELLPEPKPSNSQRSRQARKGSIERRKMSKSLAEDAMTYFDESVSISTFDSSDFSSQEDPPVNIYGTIALVENRASKQQGRSTASTTDSPEVSLKFKMQESGIQGEPIHIVEDYGLTHSSSSNTHKHKGTLDEDYSPAYTVGVQHVDIKNYVRRFEKVVLEKEANTTRSKCGDLDIETLLLDRVLFKNRINSGSLLLCGISVFPCESIL